MLSQRPASYQTPGGQPRLEKFSSPGAEKLYSDCTMSLRACVSVSVVSVGIFAIAAVAQQKPDPLAEPFKGVTTNGTLQGGLFPIRASGVSTKPVMQAATTFVEGLTAEQRAKTTYPVDDIEWRRWNNIHRWTRHGVSFKEMSDDQKTRAFGLLQAGLSAKGLEKSRNIMRLNETIAELTKRFEEYGEGLYYLTVMGSPSASEPWGWQLDGHHLVINYFVLGDQVVMTPTFMGSEPISAESGKYAGTIVLQDEQNKGLALMQALSPEQQKKATLAADKTANNALAQAFRDNLVLDYAGIRASELDRKQQQLLAGLIEEYVANMDAGHAKARMDEVREQDRRHLLRVDWINGSRERFLLPHTEPRDPDRIRSPDPGGAGRPESARPPPRAHRRPHAKRQRLRQRPAPPALREAQARVRKEEGRRKKREGRKKKETFVLLPSSFFFLLSSFFFSFLFHHRQRYVDLRHLAVDGIDGRRVLGRLPVAHQDRER